MDEYMQPKQQDLLNTINLQPQQQEQQAFDPQNANMMQPPQGFMNGVQQPRPEMDVVNIGELLAKQNVSVQLTEEEQQAERARKIAQFGLEQDNPLQTGDVIAARKAMAKKAIAAEKVMKKFGQQQDIPTTLMTPKAIPLITGYQATTKKFSSAITATQKLTSEAKDELNSKYEGMLVKNYPSHVIPQSAEPLDSVNVLNEPVQQQMTELPTEAYIGSAMQLDSWLKAGEANKLMSSDSTARHKVLDRLLTNDFKFELGADSFSAQSMLKNGESILEMAMFLPGLIELVKLESQRSDYPAAEKLELLTARNEVAQTLYTGYTRFAELQGVQLGNVTRGDAGVDNYYQRNGMLDERADSYEITDEMLEATEVEEHPYMDVDKKTVLQQNAEEGVVSNLLETQDQFAEKLEQYEQAKQKELQPHDEKQESQQDIANKRKNYNAEAAKTLNRIENRLAKQARENEVKSIRESEAFQQLEAEVRMETLRLQVQDEKGAARADADDTELLKVQGHWEVTARYKSIEDKINNMIGDLEVELSKESNKWLNKIEKKTAQLTDMCKGKPEKYREHVAESIRSKYTKLIADAHTEQDRLMLEIQQEHELEDLRKKVESPKTLEIKEQLDAVDLKLTQVEADRQSKEKEKDDAMNPASVQKKYDKLIKDAPSSHEKTMLKMQKEHDLDELHKVLASAQPLEKKEKPRDVKADAVKADLEKKKSELKESLERAKNELAAQDKAKLSKHLDEELDSVTNQYNTEGTAAVNTIRVEKINKIADKSDELVGKEMIDLLRNIDQPNSEYSGMLADKLFNSTRNLKSDLVKITHTDKQPAEAGKSMNQEERQPLEASKMNFDKLDLNKYYHNTQSYAHKDMDDMEDALRKSKEANRVDVVAFDQKKGGAALSTKEQRNRKRARTKAVARLGTEMGVTHLTGTLLDGIEKAKENNQKTLQSAKDKKNKAGYQMANENKTIYAKVRSNKETVRVNNIRAQTAILAGWMNESDRTSLEALPFTGAKVEANRAKGIEITNRAIDKATSFELNESSFSASFFTSNAQKIVELNRCLDPLVHLTQDLSMKTTAQAKKLTKYKKQFELLYNGFKLFLQHNGIDENGKPVVDRKLEQYKDVQEYKKDYQELAQKNAPLIKSAYTDYVMAVKRGAL